MNAPILEERLDESDLREIAEALARIRRRTRERQSVEAPAAISARRLLAMYDRRDEVFGPDHAFGDPAWRIMLDLHAARTSGKRVSTSAACIAAACPTSTALRMVNCLEADDLIQRSPDKQDARRRWISLTENGLAKMGVFLTGAPPLQSLPIITS